MATRIYLAGPITGHPDHKAAFARAAEAIRRGGCEPVNPADLDLGPKATWHDYMSAAQGLQCSCAATYMLDGWRGSTGATIEWWVARALGHQIMGYPR